MKKRTTLTTKKALKTQKSPFHIVPKSPWPLMTSASIFLMLLGAVLSLHSFLLIKWF